MVLVHGVDSTGGWYRTVVPILYAHFRCEPINYHEYEQHGILKAVFDPPLLALACATLVGATLIAFFSGRTEVPAVRYASVALAVLSIGLVGIANLKARAARIKKAVGDFSDQVHERTGGNQAHVIAHSFGTALCGLSVANSGFVCFSTMILAGAVLPRTFPWHQYHPHRVVRVWNDTGSRDPIGWLLFFFGILARDLGDSGRRGFIDSQHVHTQDPWLACAPCENKSGFVHNAPHGFFHSHALRRGHVETFWLPTLLDIPVPEHSQFLRWSTQLADLKKAETLEYVAMERRFLEYKWTWVGTTNAPEPILWYLEQVIERRRTVLRRMGQWRPTPAPMRELVLVALARMWALVADGRLAQAKIFAIAQAAPDEMTGRQIIQYLEQHIATDLDERAKMTDLRHAAHAAVKWLIG